MTEESRAFELLVAHIEASLVPKGAAVKSPDRIIDKTTGQEREVDVSIRLMVGSAPILITVECRKRDAIQDVTWIEQLATKRESIGAAQTIAVSSAGFSGPARKAAELRGIVLRTMEDRIGEEIVRSFLSGLKISLLVTDFRATSIGFFLAGGSQLEPAQFADSLRAALASDSTRGFATEVASGREISVEGLLRKVDDNRIPSDGEWHRAEVAIEFNPGTVLIETTSGSQPLRAVRVGAEFRRHTVEMPPTALHEYVGEANVIRRTVEAIGELDEGNDVRLLMDIDSPSLNRPPD